MNSWFLFLLKSTFILSLLYLFFRLLIRKESFFNHSRFVLVFIIFISAGIPFIHLPYNIRPVFPDKLESPFQERSIVEDSFLSNDTSVQIQSSAPIPSVKQAVDISVGSLVLYVYLAGVSISLLLFISSLYSVFLMIRKTHKRELNGVRILIVQDDIPAFSFGKYILISQYDFETNSKAILTHELSHIRQGHFYDLMLMTLVKIVYWFNPLVYFMNRDMKEIHEFQADEYTLNSGIDATQYQLLIIQKSVGYQKFALANSFNHCQIKNRITMMNKSKNSKLWNWKVATFLPVFVLLLMAFGKRGEGIIDKTSPLEPTVIVPDVAQKPIEHTNQIIELKNDGNYIDNKNCTPEQIALQAKEWRKAGNAWIHLLIDESIPLNRIDDVRDQLDGSYWVTQSTVNSDDIIYFAGDVNKLAEFKNGQWDNWINDQLNNYPEAKSLMQTKKYRISFSFIVEKNGKVRDAHVVKGSEYPEINSAYNKILAQIPDWEPALRRNDPVSVYWIYLSGNNW